MIKYFSLRIIASFAACNCMDTDDPNLDLDYLYGNVLL